MFGSSSANNFRQRSSQISTSERIFGGSYTNHGRHQEEWQKENKVGVRDQTPPSHYEQFKNNKNDQMQQLISDMQQLGGAPEARVYNSANDFKLSKATSKVDDIEAKIR